MSSLEPVRAPSNRLVVAAALFAALLPLFFHLPYFSGDRIIYEADSAQLHFPRYKILCDALQEEGGLPLWQTWLYTGSPFHANPENPTLYPPVLFFASFCSPVWTINATILLHLSAAGLGMFLLVRKLWLRANPGAEGVASAGACVGACVFALSFTTRIDSVNLVGYGATHALMPWVFLAADAVLESARPRRAAGVLGLLLGFQVLTGGLYVIPYAAISLAAWMVLLGLCGGREKARRALAYGALAAACAALIVAGKYLPYREWIGTTNRAAKLDYAEALGTSLFGDDGTQNWTEVRLRLVMYTFWGTTIALALLALPLFRRMPVVRLAIVLSLMFFGIGLGGKLHRFMYDWVPMFDQTRSAVRAWAGVNALLPILAGLGACWALACFARVRERPRLAVGIGACAAAALAPLLSHSFKHEDSVKRPDRFSELRSLYVRWPEAAQKCGTEWRAMYVDKSVAKNRNEQFISTLLEVETPAGYLGHVWPRALERHLYDTAEQKLEDAVRFRRRSTLSVKYMISTSHKPDAAPPSELVLPLYADGNVLVPNELARPRAIEPAVVAAVYGDVDSEVAYAILDHGTFPLKNASTVQLAQERNLSAAELEALDALVVCNPPSEQAALAAGAMRAAGKPVLEIQLPLTAESRERVLALEHELALLEESRRTPTVDGFARVASDATVVTRTDAARGRWIVASEPWALYGGWRATAASGAVLAIDRADGVSSAVFAPASESSFRADYAPHSVPDGLWLYAAGVVGALILALWPSRKPAA